MHGTDARILRGAILSVCVLISGCGYFLEKAGQNFGNNLSAAVLNQSDPEIVRDGAPAYLLLLDSFLESNPDSPSLLSAAATLSRCGAGSGRAGYTCAQADPAPLPADAPPSRFGAEVRCAP